MSLTLTFQTGLDPQVGFPGGTVVKNPPADAGDTGDLGSVPGSGRSPGVGDGTHSRILAWRISQAEEPGGLQSVGSQSREQLSMHEQTAPQ